MTLEMAVKQYPRDWIRTLPEESGRWVQEGLISAEQRDAIVALYPSESAGQRDRTVLIITILGSLLVGAGVILFIAANWAAIPQWAKVSMILAAIAGTYGVGIRLAFGSNEYPRLGQSLILLGGLVYGGGIWLIAQIFHLESRYPNGFLLWGLGLLPMAWAASSLPLLYLSTVVLGIWTVMEQTAFYSYNWLYPILTLGVIIPLSRRLRTALGEAAGIVGIYLWMIIMVLRSLDRNGQPSMLDFGIFTLLFGLAVLVAGLGQARDLRPYLGTAVLGILGGTYALTFDSRDAFRLLDLLQTGVPAVTGTMVGLILALAVGTVLALRRREVDGPPLLAAGALFLAGAVAVDFVGEIPRMIIFNLLLFVGTVGVVVLGVRRRSELLVNLGVVIFIIHMITRYFDLFFDALDKSVFFIFGGALLLGGGWLLERNRRRWIGEWGDRQS